MAWIFLLGSVLFAVLGQLFYKRYSTQKARKWLIIGLTLFCLAVPCTMLAARDLGVGMVYIGSSLSYIIAPVFGWMFFDEAVARSQWKYFVLIMLGVIVYAW